MNRNQATLIEEICERIKEISAKQKKSFYEENRVLYLLAKKPDADPAEIAQEYNTRYKTQDGGELMTGISVIRILRACRLTYIIERKRLLEQAEEFAKSIIGCIRGENASVHLEEVETAYKNSGKFKRMVMLYFANYFAEIKRSEVMEQVMRLNTSFMEEALESVLDAIDESMAEEEIDTYKAELVSLEKKLRNANKTIESLQESFEEQLNECRYEEYRILMSRLNSEKYGYLLDLANDALQGLKEMRRKNCDIPYEIGSLPILVRNLIKFASDCGITPIMKIGQVMTINALDVEKLGYEGEAFRSDTETKSVVVIASGWEIKDKQIVISNPRVQEVKKQ